MSNLFKRFYYKFLFSKNFFYSTFVNFIAILVGFFLANAIATILGQTGDWGLLSSGILVAFIENTNRTVYKNRKRLGVMYVWLRRPLVYTLEVINNVKIGMIYGFFVEAFKLGS